jgi:CDP-2,3-bis-(O-geranylgeranyl)-sn-glycerol synthase
MVSCPYMDVLNDIAFALWFMLPAAFANAAPILTARIPGLSKWNTRLDFGTHFRGAPLLGSHKTWRGLVSGMIVATLVLWLQQLLAAHTSWAHSFTADIDYARLPTLVLGPLFGLGALGGDALESFFKRRHGTKSGKSWFPFDQLDYVVGALLISLFFVVLSARQYILIIIIWFGLHIAGTYVGWRLGLKDQPI